MRSAEQDLRTMRKALRDYAARAELNELCPEQIRQDLLAISGIRHVHRAGPDGDLCAICRNDLRDEIHHPVLA